METKVQSISGSILDIATGIRNVKIFIQNSFIDKIEPKLAKMSETIGQMQAKLSANTAILAVVTKKMEVCN